MKSRLWAAGMFGVLLILTACGSSSSTSSAPAAAPGGASNQIRTASVSGGTVLINSQGKTIYWFAIDTPTMSKCTGSCASFWPPVPGPVKAASGVSLMHGFGTITRSDGTVQATYDGHPLYTYTGDTAAGQDNGNGKNLSGGLWWAMTPSAAKLGAAPKPGASSSSAGGGGYY